MYYPRTMPSYCMAQPSMLPPIDPRYTPQQHKSKYPDSNQSVNFLTKRLNASMSFNPQMQNFPLYPSDLPYFISGYPNSLYYNRPIRYFFQRPVQLDEENCFPHQKRILEELRRRDNQIKNQMNNRVVKYGIPKSMSDVIKQSEVVHYPTATILSAQDMKNQRVEYNDLLEKLNSFDPEAQRKLVLKAKELRNQIRGIMKFNTFINMMKNYTEHVIDLRRTKFLTVQATKACLSEIKSRILKVLKVNLEDFCCKYLGEKFQISSDSNKAREDSIFIIKSFVHQLYSDLSSAFCSSADVDIHLKDLFRHFIKEKSKIPPKYLTTFEFNRLEFDEKIRLNNMTIDRQALIVGFIVFFRIIIVDILKNYLDNFEKMQRVGDPLPEVLDQKINEDVTKVATGEVKIPKNPKDKSVNRKRKTKRNSKEGEEASEGEKDPGKVINNLQGLDSAKYILAFKRKKKEIRENFKYNFNFIIQLLSYICQSAFANNPVQYRDYFKDKYLYKELVFLADDVDDFVQLTEENNTDKIEILDGVFERDPACDLFIQEQFRWIHMYQLSTIQFCADIAKISMSDDEVAPAA
ncbi:MAG: hypothetical protein MJ252_25100 [archaeon]|nr:hypothetical protein [archaeon]